jgi:proline dehydrogenase
MSAVQTLLFPLATRFVAGDSLADAIRVVKRLNEGGLKATIDVLGEDVKDSRGADLARDAYYALIETCRNTQLSTNLSLKLSALGLAFGDDQTAQRFTSVLERAEALPDPFVRVDMEGSSLLQRTIDIVSAAFVHHRNTGPVLQAYLHRTQADVEAVIQVGMRVRLCKGAYREPSSIAWHKTSAIRQNFIACATLLLKGGTLPAFATHDSHLIGEVRRLAVELGVPKTSFEFQMLYGVRPDLQRSLARDGYSVRIYVPFGARWAQYFRRRIFERRENLIFALRSAFTR